MPDPKSGPSTLSFITHVIPTTQKRGATQTFSNKGVFNWETHSFEPNPSTVGSTPPPGGNLAASPGGRHPVIGHPLLFGTLIGLISCLVLVIPISFYLYMRHKKRAEGIAKANLPGSLDEADVAGQLDTREFVVHRPPPKSHSRSQSEENDNLHQIHCQNNVASELSVVEPSTFARPFGRLVVMNRAGSMSSNYTATTTGTERVRRLERSRQAGCAQETLESTSMHEGAGLAGRVRVPTQLRQTISPGRCKCI